MFFPQTEVAGLYHSGMGGGIHAVGMVEVKQGKQSLSHGRSLNSRHKKTESLSSRFISLILRLKLSCHRSDPSERLVRCTGLQLSERDQSNQ